MNRSLVGQVKKNKILLSFRCRLVKKTREFLDAKKVFELVVDYGRQVMRW